MNNMKKNVIVICIDGCRTDRAQKSKIFTGYLPGTVFFQQSITYAPYTNSSMFATFSGSYGNRNGCYSYWHSYKFKNEKFKTLTHYLQDQNYYTHADIASKLAIPLQNFDVCDIYDEMKANLAERHKNVLEDMKKINDDDKPFFLYLHYESIHTGIMNEVLKVYNNFSDEFFENSKKNNNRYDNLFRNAEIYLEELLDHIKKLELLKNTIVMIISDHGISTGEKFGENSYGVFCYDYTIKTFCTLISSEFKNKIITQQVRHVDFLPTLLDHIQIKKDTNFEEFDGESLIPLIFGKFMEEKIAYTETGNPLALRTRFKDSVMFIGWYMNKTNKINKIPLGDPYRQYLNYYLGWGNYANKTYKTDKKAIILAKSVEKQSKIYRNQLKECQKSLNNKYIIF